jgi:hypothetical protein
MNLKCTYQLNLDGNFLVVIILTPGGHVGVRRDEQQKDSCLARRKMQAGPFKVQEHMPVAACRSPAAPCCSDEIGPPLALLTHHASLWAQQIPANPQQHHSTHPQSLHQVLQEGLLEKRWSAEICVYGVTW